MEVIRLQEGEEVFHEGTSGDSWYVTFEGEVRVLKDADTEAESEIARLGPGKRFDEMAILDGMPRSASVRAAGPLTIFRFRRDRFDGLLAQGSLGAYKSGQQVENLMRELPMAVRQDPCHRRNKRRRRAPASIATKSRNEGWLNRCGEFAERVLDG
jgi:CRP/FNR family transcriptional regulator, cyclic AMP receptor protein